jgi:hypothetical protein
MDKQYILRLIDEFKSYNQKKIDELYAEYDPFSFDKSLDEKYYEGAIDTLRNLRDTITKKRGEE